MLRVLIAFDAFNDDHVAAITARLEDWATLIRISQNVPVEAYQSALAAADIIIGWPRAEWLRSGKIRLVLLPSAGYDEYLGKKLGSVPHLVICNTRDVYDVGAAEHCVALMLALVRNLGAHVRDANSRQWNRSRPYGEIVGATACIVGLGDIGSELAWRCAGLGMNVVGVRRHTGYPPKGVTRVYTVDRLHEAVSAAQHVFGIAPGGTDTYHMFNRSFFSAMQRNAYFYNVGRGTSADEAALIEALASGHLGGAGLDVSDPEPLEADSPLWDMENVLITPHIAGYAAKYGDRFCRLAIENLTRYRHSQPLLHVLALA
jgi:D-2-hydroxyacid dehydrogenase (NADP+)